MSAPIACLRRFAALLLVLLPGIPAFAASNDIDTIAQRVQPCTVCHGAEGRASSDGYYPRIAGKPAGYLYHQLLNFRDGRRAAPMMSYLVDRQSDAYLLEIAQHFAAQQLPYPPPQPPVAAAAALERGRQLVEHGDAARELPSCRACHGARLTGIEPAVPGLLGLPMDYLVAQLGAWQLGQRRAHAPDCMATIVQRLQPEDLHAVAAWLASQPLPADTHPAPPSADAMPMPCGSAEALR